MSKKPKNFFNARREALALFLTVFGVVASQAVCLIFLLLFRPQDAKFMFAMGFVEPLIGVPPVVFAFCYLRDELNSNKDALRKTNGHLSDTLRNVKELGRLLPMCASCKKIRTDQGYWRKMETYITNHSKAEFTHGICPACYELETGRGVKDLEKDNDQNNT